MRRRNSGSMFPYSSPPVAAPIKTPGRYALVVCLGDIKACRVERLVAFVEKELASLKSAERLVGKCRLTVDGFNNDPRDLTQIPEVRAFFSKLYPLCPLLPFLLEPVKEEAILYMLLTGDGRRLANTAHVESKPGIVSGNNVFTDRNKAFAPLIAYNQALGVWLNEMGVVQQEDHPLWIAHEKSLDSFTEWLKSIDSNLKVVR